MITIQNKNGMLTIKNKKSLKRIQQDTNFNTYPISWVIDSDVTASRVECVKVVLDALGYVLYIDLGGDLCIYQFECALSNDFGLTVRKVRATTCPYTMSIIKYNITPTNSVDVGEYISDNFDEHTTHSFLLTVLVDEPWTDDYIYELLSHHFEDFDMNIRENVITGDKSTNYHIVEVTFDS